MAKTKAYKQQLVNAYRESLKKAQSVFVVKPQGITANESVRLKKELKGLGSNYNIVKNSLFSIALEQEGLPEMTQLDHNEHAVIFAKDNVTEIAKVINNFAKESERIEIQTGLYEKKAITGEEIIKLAELPSKDVLLAQALNMFNAPLTGLLNVINANTRNLVFVLKAVADKKQA